MYMMSDELVTIATFPEPMEANMARSALEAAGIDVFLRGEVANSMVPVAFASEIQVRTADEAEARKLLESRRPEAPAIRSNATKNQARS
jgi:hypothetical protein